MCPSRTVLALLTLSTLPQLALAQQSHPDAAQLIKQRKEAMIRMHSNAFKLERMVYGMEAYKPVDAKAAAANLVQISSQVFGLFPPGSQGPDSKTRRELWQRPDEFSKYSKASQQAISDLAAATDKGGVEPVKAAYAKVPPTCVACHQAFRVGG